MGAQVPKINVYLPDDLADAVKAAGLPVSPICQAALEQAVRRISTLREGARRLDLTRDDPAADLPSFTARARTAVRLAVAGAGTGRVGTEHLLAGIIGEGDNLALRVLRALEIEPEDLAATLAALPSTPTEHVMALTDPASAAMEQAVNESIALGHNYIGCEHLLLGLIAEPTGTAGELLRALGAEQRITRRSVAAALTGFVHGRAAASGAESATGQALRAALAPLTERLDRLETRFTALENRA